jgi:hypothetical protein
MGIMDEFVDGSGEKMRKLMKLINVYVYIQFPRETAHRIESSGHSWPGLVKVEKQPSRRFCLKEKLWVAT